LQHPGAVVQHLAYIRSDHRPILLDTDYQAGVGQLQIGPRRFEAKWLKEKGFRDVVKNAWEVASDAIPYGNVLAHLGHFAWRLT
jgi:hypothetical protein